MCTPPSYAQTFDCAILDSKMRLVCFKIMYRFCCRNIAARTQMFHAPVLRKFVRTVSQFFLSRRREIFSLAILSAVGILFIYHPLFAQESDKKISGNDIYRDTGILVGNFCLGITKFMGSLLLLLTDVMLIPIASYNNFVGSPVVMAGWTIVRDLTNMFFVLMMLIISIGTILGVEKFSYRSLLPRLLIMAVLINFSKVIVGLFIDFSQVIMLTFVNGFSAAAGGNIIQLFKLKDIVTVRENVENNKDIWDFVGAQLLGLMMVLVAICVVVIMTVMLAFRIVMLWLLTILSPLVFFLSTLPTGKASQAYGEWWSMLSDYLTSGPLMAFFLWLAFSVTADDSLSRQFAANPSVTEISTSANSYFVSQAGGQPAMTGFIVGIALLLGGMYITSRAGTVGSGMLRGVADFATKTAPRALGRFAYRQTAGRAIEGTKAAAGAAAGAAERGIFASTGRMLPFSERKKKFDQNILAEKERSANIQGMEVRRGRATKDLSAYQRNAGTARAKVEGMKEQQGQLQGRQQEIQNAQKTMLQPSADKLAALRDSRTKMGLDTDSFQMNAEQRQGLTEMAASFSKKSEEAFKQGNWAEADENDQKALGINKTLKNTKDGETADWQSSVGLQEFRAKKDEELSFAEQKAKDEQFTVTGSDKYRKLEGEKQRLGSQSQHLAGELEKEEKVASTSERASSVERRRLARSPEYNALNSARATAIDDEKKRLPKNMSKEEQFDELDHALKTKNKFKAEVLLSEIGDKENLRDMLQGGALGAKFSTDKQGVMGAADHIGQRLGIDKQSAMQMMNIGTSAAAAKGDATMRGLFQQGKGGALRTATDETTRNAQVAKLGDVKENFEKAAGMTNMFTINVNGGHDVTQAGMGAIISQQEKLMEAISRNKANPELLKALNNAGNMQQIEKAVKRGLLSVEAKTAIQTAVAGKKLTARDAAARHAAS